MTESAATLDRPARHQRALPFAADYAPLARQLFILFLASFALRVAIVSIVLWKSHLTLAQFARLYDGRSYLITAQSILGDSSQFNDYHGRVFYGLPFALAALARLGIPLHVGALLLNWTSASLAAVLAARLFKDLRIGYALSFFFPHALMNSCLTASESPMLALSLGGLLLISRRAAIPLHRVIISGLLLGLSMLFRPMACFALLAAIYCELSNRNWKRIVTLTTTGALILLAGMVLQGHFRGGDTLANFRYQAHSPNAYAGQLLDRPFKALFLYPLSAHLPPARIAYLWLHAAIILLACALAARASFGAKSPHRRRLTTLSTTWLLGNTAFIACLGPPWGFECFHRFAIPATPAMWYFLRRALPRSIWLLLPIAVASATIAALTILHELT